MRNLALGAGLAVAAASLVASAGGDSGAPKAADLAGEALVAAAQTPAAAPTPAAPPSDDLSGLDLSKMELVDDHYEVALPDGKKAILTLDPTLQDAALKVLDHAKAPRGAVVITATDGRILAYAGRRGTGDAAKDPKYAGKNGVADFSLANSAWAPAASVFKLVSASAMLEAGVDPHQSVCYHGGLRSVTESNLVDDKRDNLCNDLSYGLAHSQNAIIAKLAAQNLEPAALKTMADTLGFGGEAMTWALGGETGESTVPDEKGVDFAKTAAGFEGSKLSPIGGALLANTIATGGERVTPTIVASIVDADGTKHDVAVPAPTRALPEDVAHEVEQMMVQTCDSGSAAKAFRGKDGLPRSVKVAGKTGTLSPDDDPSIEYSWFVGFAPAEAPTVSVAVVLGNTDLWWLKGHTAARMLVQAALASK
jgi:cell division protein FtsI/penicillin-binding protein 2